MTESQFTCLLDPVKSFLEDSFAPPQVTHRQEVGARIAQARREMGVRERRDVLRGELAEAVGVDPSTITAWEQGKKSPREEVLAKLAAFLGVTPAYLRYGVRPVAPEQQRIPLASYVIPDHIASALAGEPTAPEPAIEEPAEDPPAKPEHLHRKTARGKR